MFNSQNTLCKETYVIYSVISSLTGTVHDNVLLHVEVKNNIDEGKELHACTDKPLQARSQRSH